MVAPDALAFADAGGGGGNRLQDDVFESREMMDKLQKSVDALKACEKLGKDVSKVSTC